MDNTHAPAVPTPAVASNLPPEPSASRLALSYGEAARTVGCSPRTIWAACASGELRAARIGRRRLIAIDELRRWLDAKAGIAPIAAKIGGGR